MTNLINNDANVYSSLDTSLNLSSDNNLFNFIMAFEQNDMKAKTFYGYPTTTTEYK